MNRLLFLIALLLGTGLMGAREQLTNIPTVYIDTENDVAITSKENYVNATVSVVSSDAEECCTELTMGIRGRGNSTWGMAKQPYRIKLDKKYRFLNNSAKAKNWVFLANYADKTMIRNAIAFEMSKFIGMEYTPSISFVDVVLNDKYIGNYLVTDQTEVKEGRVPVEEQEPTATDEPDITGGYLIEIDGFADGEPVWFETAKGLKITVKYPKDDEINSQQLSYITDFVGEFERRLFADDFADPSTGYRSLVDEESLINWYIACELTANSDSFWSTYIYKKRNDDHLYFGPLWDFDIAFNNDNRLGDATRKLMREHAHNPKTWIQRIWQDRNFRTAVNRRWKDLLNAGIEESLLAKVDYYASQIDASQKRNFDLWGTLDVQIYLENYLFSTYQGGVDYLKEFISNRIAFLTESFNDSDPSVWAVEVNPDSKYRIRHSGGNYVGISGSTCRLASADNAAQISFVPSSTQLDYYGIELAEGTFMGSNKQWDVIHFTDISDPYALFTVEKSGDDGYVIIKNLGRGLYLGTDNYDIGGGIYTDKSGQDHKHLWRLEEIQQPSSVNDIYTLPTLEIADGYLIAPVGALVSIYNIAGQPLIREANQQISLANFGAGIYIATATLVDGTTLRLKFAI